MSPSGTAAAVRAVAVAAGLALALGGCGQLTMGEQSPDGVGSGTAATPDLTPGPAATPGCEELTEPVHRLVTGRGDTDQGDTELTSSEVRRLADGVADNALSAVASRLSGLVLQDTVDPAVVDAEWDQFRQLCDLP
ncbi:hypothetical protein [Rhodococcus sp. IEGM 1408]|uniref:hypothetical protein n=1 Tax=Rhodococcus sp. IEGM 1408 TaxID=3082220 RepID=UPI0029549D8A|nr:hypothetical protein [Rhodococcus sp. IEGM 1408]MDV7999687.1 hypothetical protein [Rhodococcus sp. IEGM 1408]